MFSNMDYFARILPTPLEHPNIGKPFNYDDLVVMNETWELKLLQLKMVFLVYGRLLSRHFMLGTHVVNSETFQKCCFCLDWKLSLYV